MALSEKEKASFQLLLKSEDYPKIYKIQSYDGKLTINNEDNEIMILNFKVYEIFYKSLIVMLQFLLGKKQLNYENIEIFDYNNHRVFWTPLIQDDKKSLKLVSSFNDQIQFQMTLEIKSFYSFLFAFGLSILPSLMLNENEKLLFQLSFLDDYNCIYKNSNIDEKLVLNQFQRLKTDFNISFDVYNALNLFKYYFTLFVLLYKANGLMKLNTNET